MVGFRTAEEEEEEEIGGEVCDGVEGRVVVMGGRCTVNCGGLGCRREVKGE